MDKPYLKYLRNPGSPGHTFIHVYLKHGQMYHYLIHIGWICTNIFYIQLCPCPPLNLTLNWDWLPHMLFVSFSGLVPLAHQFQSFLCTVSYPSKPVYGNIKYLEYLQRNIFNNSSYRIDLVFYESDPWNNLCKTYFWWIKMFYKMSRTDMCYIHPIQNQNWYLVGNALERHQV